MAASPATAAAPTFSPAGGASTYYTSTQTPSITQAATGVRIRYTLDGSAPTPFNGTVIASGGTVSIASSKTLKAVAYLPGFYSNVSTVTSAPFIIAINPSADTFVRNGTYTALNCNVGTAPGNCGAVTSNTVEVKYDTASNAIRIAYFKFPISALGSSLTSAKVRLYGAAQTAAKTYGIYGVSDSNWTETGLTNDNDPGIGAQLSTVSVGTTAAYVEFNVTAYVQTQKAAGATNVTFAVQLPTASSNGPAAFNSRENASNKPQLAAY
jgi:Fn3 associated